jgi:hypothetical protein
MKTFLAVIAAGLIGGGSAIGAFALDLIPQPKTTVVTSQAGSGELPGESAPATGDRDEEIDALKHQIEALEVRLAKETGADNAATIAALQKEVDDLKRARVVAPKPTTEGEVAVDVTPAPAVTAEFDTAVREVMTRVAEERAEERRLNQQAERLSELEAQKLQIAEFVPNLVKNQAANLGIAESVIPDVSNALVAHAQLRAEIASEIRGLRIDDLEIDDEAYKAKNEELNQSTITALSAFVDVETAEKLVTSLDRAARNNRDNNNQGGRRANR